MHALISAESSEDKKTTSSKRKHEESASGSTPSKQLFLDLNEDREGETCPICLDSWTLNGDHRLVSLKCGHLFGKSCLKNWLDKSYHYCPQCKTDVVDGDVRIIYARKVVTINSCELHEMKKELSETKQKLATLQENYKKLLFQQKSQEFCDGLCQIVRCTRPPGTNSVPGFQAFSKERHIQSTFLRKHLPEKTLQLSTASTTCKSWHCQVKQFLRTNLTNTIIKDVTLLLPPTPLQSHMEIQISVKRIEDTIYKLADSQEEYMDMLKMVVKAVKEYDMRKRI